MMVIGKKGARQWPQGRVFAGIPPGYQDNRARLAESDDDDGGNEDDDDDVRDGSDDFPAHGLLTKATQTPKYGSSCVQFWNHFCFYCCQS